MNNTRLTNIAIALVVILLTTACSDEPVYNNFIAPKTITSYSGDVIITKKDFFYNDKNQIIEEDYSVFVGDSYTRIFLFRYDNKGRLIKRERSVASGIETHSLFEYDSNDRVVKQINYGYEDRFEGFEKYVYNDLNEVDTIFKFSYDSTRLGFTHYKYDDRHNRIEELWSNYWNFKIEVFEFDNNPNIYSGLKYYHPEYTYHNNLLKKYSPELILEGNNIIKIDEENTDPNTYIYEYNEDGYPIKVIINGSPFYDIIEYINL